MVKYFQGQSVLRSSWDQVFAAFWQRYPNPYSKHVLTEDIVHRATVSCQCCSLSVHPGGFYRGPTNQTMATFTWNINHARLMVVEERCVYRVNSDNSGWTEIRREAWVSSSLFGVSRALQEFGLAWFKSNVTKTMKGFEYIFAKLKGEAPPQTLVETAKEAKEKAKETALAATEKAKEAATKMQQQQFV
ncbi:hypothetical protein FD755_016421 [Muntiacus reevesi]|uniref:PRELI/MSF1 domain-containing protein n=1 Tax=Muntiacus reevesi TaxID=9886 RepID=A0A5N3XGB6_MUNRE|nr:hypothetical protein FD755_016421 [Muntiacus reevesi]